MLKLTYELPTGGDAFNVAATWISIRASATHYDQPWQSEVAGFERQGELDVHKLNEVVTWTPWG